MQYYYSARTKNELLIHATIWWNLKIRTLSERKQQQRIHTIVSPSIDSADQSGVSQSLSMVAWGRRKGNYREMRVDHQQA